MGEGEDEVKAQDKILTASKNEKPQDDRLKDSFDGIFRIDPYAV